MAAEITSELEKCIFEQSDLDNVVKLFGNEKVPLSTLLSISHVFCDSCCDLYTPCHVGEWIRTNPELYDSEVLMFKSLLDKCGDLIEIDIEPYTPEEVNKHVHVSEVDRADRMRQLCTVILAA